MSKNEFIPSYSPHLEVLMDVVEKYRINEPTTTFVTVDTAEFQKNLEGLSASEQKLVNDAWQWELVMAGCVVHQMERKPDVYVDKMSSDPKHIDYRDITHIDYVRPPQPLAIDQLQTILTTAEELHNDGTPFHYPFYQKTDQHSILDWYDPFTLIWALHLGGWKENNEGTMWLPPQDKPKDMYILDYLLEHLAWENFLVEKNPKQQSYGSRMHDHLQLLTIPVYDDSSLADEFKAQWSSRGIHINSITEVVELVENKDSGFQLTDTLKAEHMMYEPNKQPLLYTFERHIR